MTSREETPANTTTNDGMTSTNETLSPVTNCPVPLFESNSQSQLESVENDDNPWTLSPAVTSTQSELSTASNISQMSNNNSTNIAAATEEEKPTKEEAEKIAVAASTEQTALPAPLSAEEQPQPVNPPAPFSQQDQQQPQALQSTMSAPASMEQQQPVPSVGLTPSSAGFAISAAASMPQQAPAPSLPFSSATATNAVPATDALSNNINPAVNNLFVDTNNLSQQQSAAQDEVAIEEGSSYQEGGRLWQAALKEAEKSKADPSKPRSRFAESLLERTRSRADPNAPGASFRCGKPSMVTLGDNEGSFILSTALAKKRVRVVQLLLIGLVGLLLGLLGNFFVSTSCHFATVNIMVGQNKNTFEFHFGLWKYSPIESVFQGYPYCYKYDQNYSNEAPIVARIANIVALVAGLIAISILWLYLIFGSTTKRRWKWAVRIAVLAGLVQLATLYFFLGNVCREYTCEFGPGAYLAIFTSVVWFVLACEMHYHMPVAMYASAPHGPNTAGVAALEEPSALVTTMEMTNITDDVAREYISRVTGQYKQDEMPALNMDLKRVRPKSGLYSPTSTAGGSGFYVPSPRGTYQAPDPALVEEALHGVS